MKIIVMLKDFCRVILSGVEMGIFTGRVRELCDTIDGLLNHETQKEIVKVMGCLQ